MPAFNPSYPPHKLLVPERNVYTAQGFPTMYKQLGEEGLRGTVYVTPPLRALDARLWLPAAIANGTHVTPGLVSERAVELEVEIAHVGFNAFARVLKTVEDIRVIANRAYMPAKYNELMARVARLVRY